MSTIESEPIKISIYFDGTGVNLNSNTEREYGRSVIGDAFLENPGEIAHYHNPKKTKEPDLGEQQQGKDIKTYFGGPGSDDSIYIDQEKDNLIPFHSPSPGVKYHNKLANNPQHTSSNFLGITGDGWEHNMHLAIETTINHIKNNPGETFEINVAGYSRGGITAIAFTQALSQRLEAEGADVTARVKIANAQFVDPVAGGDYGKYQPSISRKKSIANVNAIEPLRVGQLTKKCVLHLATQEKRQPFKPQLPFGLDPHYENRRPLLIPDNVDVEVRLAQACHQTIAYRHYKTEQSSYGAGIKTYESLTGKDGAVEDKGAIWDDNSDSDLIMPKKARNIRSLTDSSDNGKYKEITYDNSVLYDYYQIYCREVGDQKSFYDALTNDKNPHHDMALWAYHNSNFYLNLATKQEPSDIPVSILAKAIHCQSKTELRTVAENYIQNKSDVSSDGIKSNILNRINTTMMNTALNMEQRNKLELVKELLKNEKDQLKHGDYQRCFKYISSAQPIISSDASNLMQKIDTIYQIEQQCEKLERKGRSLDNRGYSEEGQKVLATAEAIKNNINEYKKTGDQEKITACEDMVEKREQDPALQKHRGVKTVLYSLGKLLGASKLIEKRLQTATVTAMLNCKERLSQLKKSASEPLINKPDEPESSFSHSS